MKGLNTHGIYPDLVWDVAPRRSLLEERGVKATFTPVHFPIPSHWLDRFPVTIRYILRTADLFTPSDLPQGYDFYYIFNNGFIVNDGTPHVRYLSGPPLLPQLDTVSPGLRGIPYRLLRNFYNRALRQRFPVYEFHRDSRYVINSYYTAQLFEEAHGVRLPVIHPPIDLSSWSFLPEDITSRDTVTYFSRFIEYKRPEMVLALAERYPNQRFVLMGGVKPKQRKYYETIRAKALRDGLVNTFFYDNPSDNQVKQELSRTRFFVFPAVNEHFGIVTVEAIASGALPFVHDSGGQREIVPDPRLRFTDNRFFEQFDNLINLPPETINGLRLALSLYVRRFSEEVFMSKMIAFITGSQESESKNEFQIAAL